MSNVTTLQSNYNIITNNNLTIDDILETINNLPEAGESAKPVLQSKTVSPTTSKQTITPDTGYDGLSQVTVNAMTTATQATPSITVNSSGLITASATQTAGYVSAGTKSATKQLTTKGATTWTPKTTNQTIASGTYLTGTQTIKGDSNLVASNIKSGVSIFGINGTLEEGLFIDYSPDFNEPNTAIATQETTIDQIAAALEGKAAGSTEDLSRELTDQDTLLNTQTSKLDSVLTALEGKASGGSGGSPNTCTMSIYLEKINVCLYMFVVYENNQYVLKGSLVNNLNSNTLEVENVICGSNFYFTTNEDILGSSFSTTVSSNITNFEYSSTTLMATGKVPTSSGDTGTITTYWSPVGPGEPDDF